MTRPHILLIAAASIAAANAYAAPASLLDQKWHQLQPDQVPDDVLAFEAAALNEAGVDYALVPPRDSSVLRNQSPFLRCRPPFSLNHSTLSASSFSAHR